MVLREAQPEIEANQETIRHAVLALQEEVLLVGGDDPASKILPCLYPTGSSFLACRPDHLHGSLDGALILADT